MDPWKLIYEHWQPAQEPQREALCTLGNGFFATRGAAEESRAGGAHYPGTYVGGGFNRLESEISGRRIENEDLVNWPNWLYISFRHEDGDWFRPEKVRLLEYRQELDLHAGLLSRVLRFRDDKGRLTSLRSERLVHMEKPHLAAMEWEIVPENWSGSIIIRSELDGNIINAGVPRYRELNSRHLEFLESGREGEEGIHLLVRASQSLVLMAQAARTRIYADHTTPAGDRRTFCDRGFAAQELAVSCVRKQPVRVEKIVSVHTSRDFAVSEPVAAARRAAADAPDYRRLRERQAQAWKRLWSRCDIRVHGHPQAQFLLRLHVFHLLQTVSGNSVDRDVGVPARGLHGEAYRGHIFWDELFIFPFLNFRLPALTRELLMYRYRRMDEARRMAREAGYAGAMYPWQSGSDGREESQRLHLNPRSGRWLPDETYRQRHVNAAIAYNVWQYYQVTRDAEFLSEYGAEMFLEIARFLASLARYSEKKNRYEIRGIVGPDEYHTGYPDSAEPGLDNNAYTNVMTAWALARVPEVLEALESGRRLEILELLECGDEERRRWDGVSRKMFVPFLEEGLISQFEGYERLREFPWEEYRAKYGIHMRLDRILESQGDSVDRYKASKQADVLMLFYLFPAEELRALLARLGYDFDASCIRRNVEYYEARTSHGSTLSQVVHSWVMARSHRTRSWEVFKEALVSDFSDVQGGTTAEGIHLGAMAGTVDMVQRCYTGLSVREDMLYFSPTLPEELERVELRLRFRAHWIAVLLERSRLSLKVEEGPFQKLRVAVHEQVAELAPGEQRVFTY